MIIQKNCPQIHPPAKAGSALYESLVEPVIGNIKYNLGFEEFLIRGLDGAKLELNIASITHNLKKIRLVKGKFSTNNRSLNKNVLFCLVIENNYLNCDSACLV